MLVAISMPDRTKNAIPSMGRLASAWLPDAMTSSTSLAAYGFKPSRAMITLEKRPGRRSSSSKAAAVAAEGFHLIEGMVACPGSRRLTGNGDRSAAHVTSAGKARPG